MPKKLKNHILEIYSLHSFKGHLADFYMYPVATPMMRRDDTKFPISVGVVNVRHYQDKMLHLPKYVTQASEFAGFSELAKLLLQT